MNVCPTNSGMIVQARAQVLTGVFCPDSLSFSTFWKSFASTNGPFFVERPMLVYSSQFSVLSC